MKPNELNEVDSGHRLDKSVSNMRNGLIGEPCCRLHRS